MLRVLFMVNAYPDELRPWYGAYLHAQVQALREADVEVDVLAVRGYLGTGHYVKAGVGALALNRGRRYDVVHAHYGLMGLIGRLQVRMPLVISFTGGDIQGDPDPAGRPTRSSRLKASVYLGAARLADATITKSEGMERVLPAAVRRRNHVIPTGVDLRRFAHVSREEARERLGWSLREPTVIFVGDPDRPVKNFPLAEAAVRELRRSLPEARLRVAGRIALDEIPLWMAAADAMILTSRSEGSPNVIKEAMAAELPAVSTPVGDVPERFDGVPGCFIAPPNPRALAEALMAAVRHGRTPEARRRVAAVGAAPTARRMIAVYESVLRR